MSSKNAITVCMWYKSEYYLRISVRRADIWQISCVLKTRWYNDFVLPSRIFLDMLWKLAILSGKFIFCRNC